MMPYLPNNVELIISNNNILFDTINHYIDASKMECIKAEYAEQTINISDKIDLLIIDALLLNHPISLHNVKTIINLTDTKLRNDEACLPTPCLLHDVLAIVQHNRLDKHIFCCININNQYTDLNNDNKRSIYKWIYHELHNVLLNAEKSIKLTEIENKALKYMIVAKDYIASKDDLLHEVWQYHHSSSSQTIETHMYRLKQKLPNGMIQIKNNQYQLQITIDQ